MVDYPEFKNKGEMRIEEEYRAVRKADRSEEQIAVQNAGSEIGVLTLDQV